MRRQLRGAGGSTALRWFRDLSDAPVLPLEEPTDPAQWDGLVRRAVAQVQAEFEPRSWQAFWRSAVEGIATAVVAAELGVTAASVASRGAASSAACDNSSATVLRLREA